MQRDKTELNKIVQLKRQKTKPNKTVHPARQNPRCADGQEKVRAEQHSAAGKTGDGGTSGSMRPESVAGEQCGRNMSGAQVDGETSCTSSGSSVLKVSDLPAELVKIPFSDLPVELVKMPVSHLPVGLVEMDEC